MPRHRNVISCSPITDVDHINKYQKVISEGSVKYIAVGLCPFYKKWNSMISRCYDPTTLNYKAYGGTGCTVCEEWLTFSNFKSWMETQDWEGKELDKDLLVYGNKLYSPHTCCFISRRLNSFLLENTKRRNDNDLIGVKEKKDTWRKKKYEGSGRNFEGKWISLGHYLTKEEAHLAWLSNKNKVANLFAEEEVDECIINALRTRYLPENYLNHTNRLDMLAIICHFGQKEK